MTLAERLAAALVGGAGDAMLIASDHPDLDLAAPATEAAVLVPVTDRPEAQGGPGVILTQRTDTLRHHAGQIAFPGGRIDPGEDAVAAALREAHEEIALPPAAVRVVGVGDPYRTGSGYRIVPVVGVVPPDLPLVPSEGEVADVFEVPLAFLLDPARHREASASFAGGVRHFHEIVWGDRRIWGATAAMIVNLSRRLRWS